MKLCKKICALLGTFFMLQAAAAGQGASEETLLFPSTVRGGWLWTPVTARASDYVEPVWQKDIDEATRDDTMAFGIYVGKSIQAVVDDLAKAGWQRKDKDQTVMLMKREKDYIKVIALHPHGQDKNIVGNYRIRFYVKDVPTADEMYMRAEKNFSYNFGRPNVKKGMTNVTWFLNDSFAIMVEYNQYDPRMEAVKEVYPNEVVIKREMGDYKKFFEGK